MHKSKRIPILALIIIALISIFLFLPLIITLVNSLFRDLSGGTPSGFTLTFYTDIFGGQVSMLPAIGRSLLLSILPTFIMLVLLLLTLYVVQVYYPNLDKYLDVLSKIPYGIQGVILAVSIISLYAGSNTIFSDRVLLLGGAYCIVILPYMYQGLKNALTTIELIPILEAAEILGSSKLNAYFTIVVPSILRGLIATLLLSVGILFGDFVLVNIIAGSYFETIGIFLNEIRSVSGHAASAISVVIFLVMLILTTIGNKLNSSGDARTDVVELLEDNLKD